MSRSREISVAVEITFCANSGTRQSGSSSILRACRANSGNDFSDVIENGGRDRLESKAVLLVIYRVTPGSHLRQMGFQSFEGGDGV